MLDSTTFIARCNYAEPRTSLPEEPGIYLILNTVNQHFYIGSTVNLRRRWSQHIWYLDNNRHHNPHFQNAWNKYGGCSFVYFVLEIVPDMQSILAAEQRWIDETDAAIKRDCYNVCATAGSHLGRKRSEETKQRMSRAQTGKTINAEAREKMRAAKLGRKLTPEHVEKVRQTSLGRRYPNRPEEWKQQYRKLTSDQVAELRELRAQGWYMHQLAARYGIGQSTVNRILKGFSYKGV